ncbi:hypothetical protein MBLNU13_g00439t1 [Cladosporium sp. NU13]
MSAPTVASPVVAAPIVAAPIVSAPVLPERWENGLCSNVCGGDCGTCCAAWCCPEFLYGRAAQRLEIYPHNSPSEIQTFDKHCFFYVLAGSVLLECIPTAFKREEMRKRFAIDGDFCEDIAASMFCRPCTLAQMNSEMKSRAAKEQLTKAIGYQPQTQGMVYLPPNQQPQVSQQPPLQPQPPVQEKKSTQQGV